MQYLADQLSFATRQLLHDDMIDGFQLVRTQALALFAKPEKRTASVNSTVQLLGGSMTPGTLATYVDCSATVVGIPAPVLMKAQWLKRPGRRGKLNLQQLSFCKDIVGMLGCRARVILQIRRLMGLPSFVLRALSFLLT